MSRRGTKTEPAKPARKSTKSKAPPVSRSEAPKKTGRLPVQIDPKVVESMAYANAPTRSIADYFEVSADTIERRFAANLRKGRARRDIRLGQIQMEEVEKGNTAIVIFLAKNYLGQTDRHDVSLKVDPAEFVKMSDAELAAEAKKLGLP